MIKPYKLHCLISHEGRIMKNPNISHWASAYASLMNVVHATEFSLNWNKYPSIHAYFLYCLCTHLNEPRKTDIFFCKATWRRRGSLPATAGWGGNRQRSMASSRRSRCGRRQQLREMVAGSQRVLLQSFCTTAYAQQVANNENIEQPWTDRLYCANKHLNSVNKMEHIHFYTYMHNIHMEQQTCMHNWKVKKYGPNDFHLPYMHAFLYLLHKTNDI
jgi:hypothetical protein